MDHLLSRYEYGLGLFVRALGDFAIRYPKTAAWLGIQSGRTDDPQVTRQIQTFSSLAARFVRSGSKTTPNSPRRC
ncbi:type VI secretion system baseplate subunit TssF [Burkholderia vietnamiensis]|uniref:Uncharacterized protein n=1 Tax=Burkholderia vietnamiensis (strain G4 / LMG 22486) TaxID=269482 RepID=A4JB02_BURVG|nr:type VI secretion system baseplate subunit TssF [Burkholderia vietnamiensis]ABO53455.1 hypothetical protein Bcep1808_0443 [Burkholderia vietnamiensis G4]MBH9647084.1 type VI secretion system baseplate subunit TssF [Burkholderia vietnamiensis]MBR8006290.1 type VI secretion system baseplate subunit TssF [Burkholderia vietnamiensis]MBR8051731.1 type VI secretion system baseplate subunit TssF [Burkholderia vietnamiensis]MBR8216866.1 type VI secretion system baseplate subunit TssF [Burkholderia 